MNPIYVYEWPWCFKVLLDLDDRNSLAQSVVGHLWCCQVCSGAGLILEILTVIINRCHWRQGHSYSQLHLVEEGHWKWNLYCIKQNFFSQCLSMQQTKRGLLTTIALSQSFKATVVQKRIIISPVHAVKKLKQLCSKYLGFYSRRPSY